MMFRYHRGMWTLNPCVMIPALKKLITPQPYQLYRLKTGSCINGPNKITKSKIVFLCLGKVLQIFKYRLNWATLYIHTCKINSVYQEMQ